MKEPKLDLATLHWIREIFHSQINEQFPYGYTYEILIDQIKKIEIEKLANRKNLEEKLFEYQCYLIGKKPSEVTIGDDFWRENNPISQKGYERFRGFSIPLIRKVLHINKSKAEIAFDKFYKQFGLRIKKL